MHLRGPDHPGELRCMPRGNSLHEEQLFQESQVLSGSHAVQAEPAPEERRPVVDCSTVQSLFEERPIVDHGAVQD